MSCSFIGGITRNLSLLSNVGFGIPKPIGLIRCLSLSRKLLDEKSKFPGSGNGGNGIVDPDGYSIDLDEKGQQKLENFKKIIEKNTYYEKYKTKIVETQKSSPKSFLNIIDHLVSAGKKVAGLEQKKMSFPTRTCLDDVMKLEMLLKIDREDIIFIWQEYHLTMNVLAATMNSQMFEKICARGTLYPTFVLPLPKSTGYEMFVVQYATGSFYFTPLIKYQKYKENSPVCLSLVHYTELKDDKDLILMRGEWDKDSISLMEAQFLTVQLNLYYGESDEQRLNTLKTFNENPSDFDHRLVFDELRRMQTDFPHLFPELKK